MKLVGFSCLGLGFLLGSFFLVNEKDAVPWSYFLPCAAVMLVGLVLVRVARSREHGQVDVHHGRIEVLETALASLAAKLGALNAQKDQLSVFDVHGRLDREMQDDLGNFVEDREALIHVHGMQNYADIMSVFAGSERLINRAWSASVDGYVDEVWRCLAVAEQEVLRARELLGALRAD